MDNATNAHPIPAEALTADAVQVVEVHADADRLWWIELDPAKGRYSVLRDGGDLTPPGRSASSRVHEYGGAALRVHQGRAWFVDRATQVVVELDGHGGHRELTEQDGRRFADLIVDTPRGRLLAVCEDHRPPGEAVNSLVAIDLESGSVTEVADGQDFYANPRLSPDGQRLAYLCWDHPYMPWDAAQLIVGTLDPGGAIEREEVIAGGGGSSAGNPVWAADNSLYFTWDLNGWWQLWTRGSAGPRAVGPDDADYGVPGLNHPDFDVDERSIIAVQHVRGRSRLVLIDRATGQSNELAAPGTHLRAPRFVPGGIALLAGSATDLLGLWVMPEGEPARKARGHTPAGLDRSMLTEPETIRVTARDGAEVAAHLYLPTDGGRTSLPTLVHVHGGPVGANPPVLMLGMYSLAAPSYWTSRGFAYLDVDYRGTLRYGRAYWQHLYGRWGQTDVDDAEDVTLELIERGIADPQRVAIRGASAGGWTVCCAMTRETCFRAGTALFPVSDLVRFHATTHKYESHYMESLIGPFNEDEFTARAPITRAGDVHGPMLFIQGDADKVCPPDQSETMVEAIRAAGGRAELVMIPDEGHGFVRAASNTRSLHAEERFYREVFDLEVHGDVE